MDLLDYLSDADAQRRLLDQSWEHVRIVGAAMLLAALLGLLLGVTAHRRQRLRQLILDATATVLPIPSLALFALILPLAGLGTRGPIIVLTLYGLVAVVRNTVLGLSFVDPAVVESAAATGMDPTRRLWRIELPNAWPVLLAGLRTSTLLAVGIAAIAAVVGGDGLGQEILRGIRHLDEPGALASVLGGTLAILVLATLFDLVYLAIGRLTVPRGVRD